MREPKTFGELSLQDTIYFCDDDNIGVCSIKKVEEGDERNTTKISISTDDWATEEIDFPSDETLFNDEDSDTKFTTDKSIYRTWNAPFIKKQIEVRQNKIKILEQEIIELATEIAGVPNIPNTL